MAEIAGEIFAGPGEPCSVTEASEGPDGDYWKESRKSSMACG